MSAFAFVGANATPKRVGSVEYQSGFGRNESLPLNGGHNAARRVGNIAAVIAAADHAFLLPDNAFRELTVRG